ncbi:hypothetical protein JW711_00245 [Candidatus Woesearchaeota archaeon]|nr:hypothetical protein [Candidatus Woesearchaeota archaeon]
MDEESGNLTGSLGRYSLNKYGNPIYDELGCKDGGCYLVRGTGGTGVNPDSFSTTTSMLELEGSDDVCLSFWGRINQDGGEGFWHYTLEGPGPSYDPGYRASYMMSGQIYGTGGYRLMDNDEQFGTSYVTSPFSFENEELHNYILCEEPGNGHFTAYVDGVQVMNETAGINLSTVGNPSVLSLVGNEPGDGFNFGIPEWQQFDEIGIWNRMLTQEEIDQLQTQNPFGESYEAPSAGCDIFDSYLETGTYLLGEDCTIYNDQYLATDAVLDCQGYKLTFSGDSAISNGNLDDCTLENTAGSNILVSGSTLTGHGRLNFYNANSVNFTNVLFDGYDMDEVPADGAGGQHIDHTIEYVAMHNVTFQNIEVNASVGTTFFNYLQLYEESSLPPKYLFDGLNLVNFTSIAWENKTLGWGNIITYFNINHGGSTQITSENVIVKGGYFDGDGVALRMHNVNATIQDNIFNMNIGSPYSYNYNLAFTSWGNLKGQYNFRNNNYTGTTIEVPYAIAIFENNELNMRVGSQFGFIRGATGGKFNYNNATVIEIEDKWSESWPDSVNAIQLGMTEIVGNVFSDPFKTYQNTSTAKIGSILQLTLGSNDWSTWPPTRVGYKGEPVVIKDNQGLSGIAVTVYADAMDITVVNNSFEYLEDSGVKRRIPILSTQIGDVWIGPEYSNLHITGTIANNTYNYSDYAVGYFDFGGVNSTSIDLQFNDNVVDAALYLTPDFGIIMGGTWEIIPANLTSDWWSNNVENNEWKQPIYIAPIPGVTPQELRSDYEPIEEGETILNYTKIKEYNFFNTEIPPSDSIIDLGGLALSEVQIEGDNNIIMNLHLLAPPVDLGVNTTWINVYHDYWNKSDYTFVNGLWVSDENPAANESIDVRVTIQNIGSSPSGETDVRFYDNDELLATVPLASLDSGESVQLTVQFASEADGVHFIRAVVDEDDLVEELDPDNNEIIRVVLVGDVTNAGNIIVNGGVSPSSVELGQKIYVHGSAVYNTTFGSGTSVKGADVRVSFAGGEWTTHTNADGNYGIYVPVAYEVELGPQDVQVSVTDFTLNGEDSDSVTVNNPPLPPEPQPDLTFYLNAISTNPQYLLEGENATLKVNVRNRGNADASGFNVSVYKDEVLLARVFISQLATSGSTDFYLPLDGLERGQFTIRAYADEENSVNESIEYNNERTAEFIVWGLEEVDLHAYGTWIDGVPLEGNNLIIRARIYNQGPAEAGSFNVRFTDNGQIMGSIPASGLAGHSYFDVPIHWDNVTPGIHYIQVYADIDDVIAEAPYYSNVRTDGFYIHYLTEPLPDLQVRSEDISFSDENPAPGDNITISVAIHNIGQADAGRFNVTVYEDFTEYKDVLEEFEISALPIGSTETVALDYSTGLPGSHVILVEADSHDEVIEVKSNNKATRAIVFMVPCTDEDGDGYGVGNITNCEFQLVDCDDSNPLVNPNASETCNGVDDNCDGIIDENPEGLCSDGVFCNGAETCGGVSGCLNATPLTCDDSNECTDNVCNEDLDVCENPYFSYGTSCGLFRTCPADQCSSTNPYFGLFYPESGQDFCNGLGSCTEYSCELEDSSCCDPDLNDSVGGLACSAECDEDSDCQAYCEGDTSYRGGSCGASSCACSFVPEDCNSYDCSSNVACIGVGTESIWEDGDDYSCGVGADCIVVGTTSCSDTWTCDALNECNALQSCAGSNYVCYDAFNETYTWATDYLSSEVGLCGDGKDNDCDGQADEGYLNVEATLHVVKSSESYPETGWFLINDSEVRVFDRSAGSCVEAMGGSNWQHYEDIWNNCMPVQSCITDVDGECSMDVGEGSYVTILKYVQNATSTIYEGQVDNTVCDETTQTKLTVMIKPNGKGSGGKVTTKTGSLLYIIEPEYVVWDGDAEPYPFILLSEGDWNVTVTIDPPEGFESNYDSLNVEVNSDEKAVQFQITDIGSDWVPTDVTFEIYHKGKKTKLKSKIGVGMTEELAKQKDLFEKSKRDKLGFKDLKIVE